ncbi:MAG TPA: 4-(cytidine 5'-diphospho)-2-C-methyl-D-erythritol kinase [Pirellulales bacterium]|nr:4-(cytidine 5'-diphospho)-2-C-methyl-D-erythritol kinase [Pirellulales bacterium]
MDARRGFACCDLLAPAKLNLLLEVLARREDGFHEIETLMVPINLFDSLTVRAEPEGSVRLRCRWAPGLQMAKRDAGPSMVARQATSAAGGRPPIADWEELPERGENIVVRAIELLRLRAGTRAGAVVALTKRIPSAAGLGGGSSDAAAALVAANRVWNLGWSREQLHEVAAEIGSDVPFFLDSGAALCRGRGERIEALPAIPAMNFVVVAPPGGLSTADVYRGCRPAAAPRRAEVLAAALRTGDMRKVAAAMHNGLGMAAEQLSPWIGRVKHELADCGCTGVQMSGSGTSCFGICRTSRHARRAARWMRARGWSRSAAVRSID